MSKKLLIAVLTIGLLFALSSTVMSYDGEKFTAEPIQKINTAAPRYNDLTEVQRPGSELQKPVAPVQAISPVTILPPPYYCEFIDYSGPWAFFQNNPALSGDVTDIAMRFTTSEGYACTLLTIYIPVYPDGFVGTPDMDVIVWDDDGFGAPGTELFRTTIPYADLPTATDYVVVDVSSYNFVWEGTSGDANFHVGAAGNVASFLADGSQVAFLMDDGSTATGRHSILYQGTTWTGWATDYAYGFSIDVCCAELPYSVCERQEYDCGAAYFWEQPDAYGDDYFNMRMSVEGPETISAVGVAMYAPATVGTPDLDVFIWGSDAGFPDLSDVWYQTTIANGDIVYYPDYNHVDVYSENLVPRVDFHVGWSTNEVSDPAGVLAGLSDDGSCGTLRSSEYFGAWGTMYDDWGIDVNFLIYADMCEDKFDLCQTEYDYCGLAYVYGVPNGYGADNQGYYQKVSPTGLGCRLEKVRIAFYQTGAATYTSDVLFQVYASDGADGDGLPGTLLGEITVAADTVLNHLYPDMMEVDFTSMNILFDQDIWIGAKTTSATDIDFQLLSDDGSCYSGFRECQFNPTYGNAEGFIYGDDFWAEPANMVMEADVCCDPPPEDPCLSPTGWPVAAHDFRRTNRSKYSDGDAQCKQDLLWYHNDAEGFGFNRPIIYGDQVIVAYDRKLQSFDINTGAINWTISGLPEINAGFRNSVAVADGKVFFGGGSARSFNCADATTGAILWSRNIVAGNAFIGTTQYAIPVILNDVVYFTTEIASPPGAELVALNVADGTDFAGWATNPIMLDGQAGQTLAADPTLGVLYVGTDGNGASGYGSIYAIDAATGATVWQLSETELYPYAKAVDEINETVTADDVQEEFYGPIAVDLNGDLYVQSAFDPNTEINGPPDGVHYRIASDGSVVWGVRGGANFFSGATLDVNTVYYVGISNWLDTDEPLVCRNKNTGALIWSAADVTLFPEEWSEAFIEGILECTLYEHDMYYQGSMNEPIFFAMDSDADLGAGGGSLAFEYHFNPTGSVWGTGLAMDSAHMVFTNRQGDIYVMTEQADRPRLRILKTDEYAEVPFFSPNGFLVTYDDVFMNNGCANLQGNLTVDEAAPVSITGVDPDRMDRMMSVADGMVDYSYPEMVASLSRKNVETPRMSREDLAEFSLTPYAKDSYSNTAAYAPPTWLNGITVSSFDLAPGDAFSVTYDINGPLVTRGQHPAYVTINLTNEQYYLNAPGLNPTVQLGIIGGCTASTDTLYFGTTAQNYSVVYNTGQIAGDAREDGFMISIDGEEEYFCYFAGYLYFAQDPFKVAWAGFTDGTYWETLLTDPNCAGQCETYFERNIILGQYTTDGVTYNDILGDAGTYTFVDSCVNYDCAGSGWDWSNLDCPFDNAYTMGISVKCTEYGAFGVPELNNFKICKLEITNRDSVNPIIDPIYYAMWVDHDLGVSYDDGYDWGQFYFLEDYDVAWGGACGGGYETATNVWGAGTIGHDMRGVRTLRADMCDGDLKHDSAYYWMANELGATYQPLLGPACFDPASDAAVGDRQAFYSFSGFTFGPGETITTGYYIFGYSAVAGGLDTYDTAAVAQTALNAQQFAGFGRGDLNDDGVINLADVVYLYNYVDGTALGPKFLHLADVDASGEVDLGDVLYLANYCFCAGPAPVGEWTLPDICPAP